MSAVDLKILFAVDQLCRVPPTKYEGLNSSHWLVGLTMWKISGIAESRSRNLHWHRRRISDPERQGMRDVLLQGRG